MGWIPSILVVGTRGTHLTSSVQSFSLRRGMCSEFHPSVCSVLRYLPSWHWGLKGHPDGLSSGTVVRLKYKSNVQFYLKKTRKKYQNILKTLERKAFYPQLIFFSLRRWNSRIWTRCLGSIVSGSLVLKTTETCRGVLLSHGEFCDRKGKITLISY